MKFARSTKFQLGVLLAISGAVGISNWRDNEALKAMHEVGVLQTQQGEQIASVSVGSGPALNLVDQGQGVIRTPSGGVYHHASQIGIVNLNAPNAENKIRQTLCGTGGVDCAKLIAQTKAATATSQFQVPTK